MSLTRTLYGPSPNSSAFFTRPTTQVLIHQSYDCHLQHWTVLIKPLKFAAFYESKSAVEFSYHKVYHWTEIALFNSKFWTFLSAQILFIWLRVKMWQFIAGKLKTFQERDRNWVNENALVGWSEEWRWLWAAIRCLSHVRTQGRRGQPSANQRPGWGHKWPMRGRRGAGCRHRMRVTGTLIEIKN